jgi:dihydroneopterin aldolase/2-amino-4-hydroxy-6-hydroxymethyldihydropteridine diphosphokinase
MNEIRIKGLKITAFHGVLESEKVISQPFVFDITLHLDFYGAYKTDDLEKTINYDEVCNLVAEKTTGCSYNLIEKLAYDCAFMLVETYPSVHQVDLVLSKPSAPVKQEFGDINVAVSLKRTTCYLSLGSSMGDKRAYLDFAISELDKTRGIKIVRVSDYVKTEPYGGVAQNEFLNCAIEISTVLAPHDLLFEINEIERRGNRIRDLKWGDRTLDIDIIFYGDEIICDERLVVPHADYQNRDFVLTPLKQIAPNFVCPLTKRRIKDF